MLYRTTDGFTQARRVSEMQGIKEFMAEGALLGRLWMEGRFEVGDPLSNAGAGRRPPSIKKSANRRVAETTKDAKTRKELREKIIFI